MKVNTPGVHPLGRVEHGEHGELKKVYYTAEQLNELQPNAWWRRAEEKPTIQAALSLVKKKKKKKKLPAFGLDGASDSPPEGNERRDESGTDHGEPTAPQPC